MLRPVIDVPDFSRLTKRALGKIEELAQISMQEAALRVKQDWRNSITGAGLGSRLANTVRGVSYPKSGSSINPAAFIYSKAPEIMDAFSRGPVIYPHGGRRYLWIPTKRVPRQPGKRSKRMTPPMVEVAFQAKLQIEKGKRGELLAFIDMEPRARAAAAAFGRARERKAPRVLMFVLKRTVRAPKYLDLQAMAEAGGAEFVRGFTARLSR